MIHMLTATPREAIKVSAYSGQPALLEKVADTFHEDMLVVCEDWNDECPMYKNGRFYTKYWGQDEDEDGWEVWVLQVNR